MFISIKEWGINKTDKHPSIFEGGESQGFLEKYYSRYEIGDFFKNRRHRP